MTYITPPRKVERLTSGDEAFRSKFKSWNMADLSFIDINEYLKEKE